jgi:hypothetical protein
MFLHIGDHNNSIIICTGRTWNFSLWASKNIYIIIYKKIYILYTIQTKIGEGLKNR